MLELININQLDKFKHKDIAAKKINGEIVEDTGFQNNNMFLRKDGKGLNMRAIDDFADHMFHVLFTVFYYFCC